MKKIKNVLLDNLILSLREIWSFDKRLVFILIINIFIEAVSPFPYIFLSGRIVDSLVLGKYFGEVTFYIFLLFSIRFILMIITTLMTKMQSYLIIKLNNKFDNDVNKKCLDIDYERFNDPSMQDRIQMINQAIKGNNYLTGITTVFSILSHIITLIGIISIMTSLNIWMFLIAIIIITLQSILYYIQLKHDRKIMEDSANDRRKNSYASQLAKDIKCKKDIIMFGMSDFILKKIKLFQKAILEYDKRQIKESGIINIIISSLNIVFQISAYLLMGINVFGGKISIGDFTVGVTSLINFMSASSFVTSNIIGFNDNLFYIKQYKSFCQLKSKIDSNPDSISIDKIDLNHITFEFRNVSFRYPNSTAFVLKNINLKIDNAERLGIVGYNGAGKTTFTLLLTRMYDPTEGNIYLNGVDIRNIDYKEYQRIISSVNQDFSLLSFSLLENIAIIDEVTKENKEKVLSLLKENGLSERLKKLYRGLDTPVTKSLSASGVDFSGGEQQKIAIVRALYKDAPALILDEPTSALDPMAEHEIFLKFAEMSDNKTTIFISHRIYSTRFCDKIAVFDKGEIKEYGTFQELIRLKGLYYDFYQQQADYFNDTNLK